MTLETPTWFPESLLLESKCTPFLAVDTRPNLSQNPPVQPFANQTELFDPLHSNDCAAESRWQF